MEVMGLQYHLIQAVHLDMKLILSGAHGQVLVVAGRLIKSHIHTIWEMMVLEMDQ
jgi:hypothetical protein